MALPNNQTGNRSGTTQYKAATYWKTSSEYTANQQWLGCDNETDSFGYYSFAGSPEGNVAANTGSYCSDTDNGAIYVKTTDTVNTGWVLLTTNNDNLYATPYIVDVNDLGGNSFTTIQAAIDAAVADGSSSTTPYTVMIRQGFYTENLTLSDGEGIFLLGLDNTKESTAGVVLVGTITRTGTSTLFCSNLLVSGLITLAVPGITEEFYNCRLQGGVISPSTFTVFRGCNFNSTGVIGFSQLFNCYNFTAQVRNSESTACLNCTQFTIDCDDNASFYAIGCDDVFLTGSSTNTTLNRIVNSTFAPGANNYTSELNVSNVGVSDETNSSINPSTSNFSLLQTIAGNILTSRVVDANSTVTRYNQYIGVNGNASAVTLTLPDTSDMSLAPYRNQYFIFKDEEGTASTNNITVATNGGNIDGASSFVMNEDYQSIHVKFDGTNYWVF